MQSYKFNHILECTEFVKFLMVKYNMIGLMSGTSLDGIDIVNVSFKKDIEWTYKINHSACYEYPTKWLKNLKKTNLLKGNDLLLIDQKYGDYLGVIINQFISENKINKSEIHAISSHGHTIFHQPIQKLTYQIGCGASIASKTQLTVINDFRSLDVAFGGQGAPLVPVGDELLFNKYDYCLNIGGIANISFNKNKNRIAGDIGFANMFSNELSNRVGKDFDENGDLAKSGKLNKELLNQMNSLEYFKKSFPKSLGMEDFKQWYLPIVNKHEISIEDKLHTAGFHLCSSIEKIIDKGKTVLITGGGTFNKFWISTLQDQFNIACCIPKNTIINYKEALIFAFLGLLRLKNIENTYSSVTGASKNLKSGVIHNP
jgi:anhydro-N-acetylmuramic acid kinase